MLKYRSILIYFTCLISFLSLAQTQTSNIDSKKISRSLAYTLPVFHLNRLPLDEHISTNAFKLFIDSLDPNRSYFLQDDINQFRIKYPNLHKGLLKGDTSFSKYAHTILLERMKDRLQYTKDLLNKGFNFTIDESFIWDRSDLDWAKDNSDWDNLWRKRIKNEYIGKLISNKLDEENDISNETSEKLITKNKSKDSDSNYTQSIEEFIIDRYEQFLSSMKSFDEEMLLQRYLSAFSQVYDPHSDYLSPSSVEDFNINMKLSLVGIGAMLRPEDGAATIVRLIPGGPAEKDGRLKEGDQIIAVAQGDSESQSIMHWPLYKAVRLIRGEKDSKVVLTVISEKDRNNNRTRVIDLIRDEVKLEEQAAKSEIHEIETEDNNQYKVGVITLPDFYADFTAANTKDKNIRRCSTDVRNLIDEMKYENIEGLILDLRNNGGGSLVEAIEIAGLFIPSGPIVQVKERRSLQILPDADPETYYSGPLIILVNRLSASASEILAAALQDYNRAIIIGDEHTHGKGTVQTLMSLGDKKGSIKITTASYYRINGGSTQLHGVKPDIILPSLVDVMEIGEKTLNHALPWDTIRPAIYKKKNNFDEIIPELSQNSLQRRNNNDEFQRFLNQRDRLSKRYESKSVSLVLSDRFNEAEIDNIQDDFLLDEDSLEKDDLILNETLQILGDWLDIEKDPKIILSQEFSIF